MFPGVAVGAGAAAGTPLMERVAAISVRAYHERCTWGQQKILTLVFQALVSLSHMVPPSPCCVNTWRALLGRVTIRVWKTPEKKKSVLN